MCRRPILRPRGLSTLVYQSAGQNPLLFLLGFDLCSIRVYQHYTSGVLFILIPEFQESGNSGDDAWLHYTTADVGLYPRVHFDGFRVGCLYVSGFFGCDAFRVLNGSSMEPSMESLVCFVRFIYHVTIFEWSLEGLAYYQFGGACDRPLKQ